MARRRIEPTIVQTCGHRSFTERTATLVRVIRSALPAPAPASDARRRRRALQAVLALVLASSAASAQDATRAASVSSTQPAAQPGSSRPEHAEPPTDVARPLAYTAFGLSAGSLLVSLALAVRARTEASRSHDLCPTSHCASPEGLHQNDLAARDARWSTLAFAASATFGALGGVLLYVAPSEGGGVATIGASGRFLSATTFEKRNGEPARGPARRARCSSRKKLTR